MCCWFGAEPNCSPGGDVILRTLAPLAISRLHAAIIICHPAASNALPYLAVLPWLLLLAAVIAQLFGYHRMRNRSMGIYQEGAKIIVLLSRSLISNMELCDLPLSAVDHLRCVNLKWLELSVYSQCNPSFSHVASCTRLHKIGTTFYKFIVH